MKLKTLRHCLVVLALTFAVSQVVRAQEQLVKFYPIGEPSYCKGCGHAGMSYWKLTIRLQNISGNDLIVYGDVIGGEFDALNYFQRRNTNTCEWEYGTGETKRRVSWKEMRDHERVPRILKPNEVIDSVVGFGGFEHGIVMRHTAFVAKSFDVEPTEIFSTPYTPTVSHDPNTASYTVASDSCSPLCTIALSESPRIAGIRLGMTIKDFLSLYPKEKVRTIYKRPDLYQTAYVWQWTSDAYSINITFINSKVESIRPKFHSLEKARDKPDFWQRVSSTIGLPTYWQPFMSEWKCPDFVVEVVTNENPDIFIQTPEFMRVQTRINEEALKKH